MGSIDGGDFYNYPDDGYVTWDGGQMHPSKKQALEDLFNECPWVVEYNWGRIRRWKWKILHKLGRRKHVHMKSPAKNITYIACMSQDAVLRAKVEGKFVCYSTTQKIYDSYKKRG